MAIVCRTRRSRVERGAVLDASPAPFLYCAMRCREPRVSLLVVLLLVCCSTTACARKEAQYPEDHQRYVKIDRAVEELRTAYASKSLSRLESLFLPMDTLERLTVDIKRDFQSYEEIALEWGVDRIMIQGDSIEVYLHWQGHWKKTAADTGFRERGHGMLRWVGVHSILLSSIEGDLPFGISSRHGGGEPRRTGS